MLLIRKPWTTQPPGVVPVSKVWAPSVAIIPTPGAELHDTANAAAQRAYLQDFAGTTTGKWSRNYPLYAQRRPLKGGGVGIYRNYSGSAVYLYAPLADILAGVVDSFTVALFVDLSGASGAMGSLGFFNSSNQFALQVPAFNLAADTITLRAIWGGHWTGSADAAFTNVGFANGLVPIIVRYANGNKRVQIGRQSQTIAASFTKGTVGDLACFDGGEVLGSVFHGMYVFPRYITDDETEQLVQNMYAPLEQQAIWLPESAGGGVSSATITQADGAATTSTLAATSTAATAITQAAGAATASTLAASSVAASAFTQADGAATTSTLAGTAATSAAITAAAGAATASTLAASSTAVTALAQADGAATPSTLAGSSTAAAAITQADGVATTSTLAGAAGSASITPADGAATTSTMAGTSTAVSAFDQADGAATASSLPGTSTAVAAITPAAGDATAATMASDSGTIVSATMSPASGAATASAFAASAVAASVCIAAAGVASAQTVAATSQAVAAISAAAGVATCSTLVDANGVDTNSAWWTYTVAADNLTFTIPADDLTYSIDATTLAGAST